MSKDGMIEKRFLVFSAYITLRNGRRLYARDIGKKAFCFIGSAEETG